MDLKAFSVGRFWDQVGRHGSDEGRLCVGRKQTEGRRDACVQF